MPLPIDPLLVEDAVEAAKRRRIRQDGSNRACARALLATKELVSDLVQLGALPDVLSAGGLVIVSGQMQAGNFDDLRKAWPAIGHALSDYMASRSQEGNLLDLQIREADRYYAARAITELLDEPNVSGFHKRAIVERAVEDHDLRDAIAAAEQSGVEDAAGDLIRRTAIHLDG